MVEETELPAASPPRKESRELERVTETLDKLAEYCFSERLPAIVVAVKMIPASATVLIPCFIYISTTEYANSCHQCSTFL